MLGRIALYFVGACLALGGALFVLEGFTTRFDSTAVTGLVAVAAGILAIKEGMRLGRTTPAEAIKAQAEARRTVAAADDEPPAVASFNMRTLLQVLLVVIGVPLTALGLLSFTESPSGPMAALAYILGGASLLIGLAALYGAWSLRRRSP